MKQPSTSQVERVKVHTLHAIEARAWPSNEPRWGPQSSEDSAAGVPAKLEFSIVQTNNVRF